MLNLFARLFSPKTSPASPVAVAPVAQGQGAELPQTELEGVTEFVDPGAPYAAGHPVPRWPDHGAAMVTVPPQTLLETQQALISRIRSFSPLMPAEFDHLLMPVFLRYAEWVHLLPASETHHHFGPGGLLTHGFEVAAHAARIADGKQVGTDLNPSERAKYQPRWKTAAMLGGLLHDLGKPLVDVGATNQARTIWWSAHAGSLYSWLQAQRLSHYHFFWRAGERHERHKPVGTAITREILGPEVLAWLLDEPTQDVINLMMMSIANGRTSNNLMSIVVSTADSNSVEEDLRRLAERTRGSGAGGHQSAAALIMHEIRRMMEAQKLTINKPGGHIWVTSEGCFGTAEEMVSRARDHMVERNIVGLPGTTALLVDLLVETGFLEPALDPAGKNAPASKWQLTIAGEGRDELLANVPLSVVKFVRPDLLFGNLPLPAAVKATARAPFVTAADQQAAAESVEVLVAPQTVESALSPAGSAPPTTAMPPPSPPTQSAAPTDGDGPHIETRRNRQDLAPSIENQRRQERRAENEPNLDLPQAMARVEKIGFAGAAFVEVLARIASGRLVWSKDAFETGEGLIVRYPAGFDGLGMKPEELLKLASEAKCLVTDMGSERKTTDREFPGGGGRQKVVILSGAILAAWKILRNTEPGILEGKPVNLDQLLGNDDPGTVAERPATASKAATAGEAAPRGRSESPAAPLARQQRPATPNPTPVAQTKPPEAPATSAPARPSGQRGVKPDRPVTGAAPAAHRKPVEGPRENIMAVDHGKPATAPAATAASAQENAPQAAPGIERPGYVNKVNGQGGNSLAANTISDLTAEKVEQINGYCWLVMQRAVLGEGREPDPNEMRNILTNYAKRIKVRHAPLIKALSTPDNPAFLFKRPDSMNPVDVKDFRINPDYTLPDWVKPRLDMLKAQLSGAATS